MQFTDNDSFTKTRMTTSISSEAQKSWNGQAKCRFSVVIKKEYAKNVRNKKKIKKGLCLLILEA